MATSLGDVQQTFSSWDSCMSKDYCKWPAIVGIIIGSLIVLSIVFCIARCLCFGAECCACCFSCLSCCCPSRSRRGGGRQGYQNYNQPPPMPYQQYPQYNSPPPPMYGQPSPYRGPQTATFDAPTKPTARFNEDTLPSMPSWDNATTRHVEEEPVEMDRLGASQAQQQHLLANHEQDRYAQGQPYGGSPAVSPNERYAPQPYSQIQPVRSPVSAQSSQYAPYDTYSGDVGNMSARPYHDYNDHQQYAPTLSPVSTMYAPSTTAPPSYHTRAPSVVSPVQSNYNPIPNRRPVQGSWRDV